MSKHDFFSFAEALARTRVTRGMCLIVTPEWEGPVGWIATRHRPIADQRQPHGVANMARSPKTPDTNAKPTTPKAEVPANPPVTFSLEAVDKIVAEALAKQAEAMAAAKPAVAKGKSSKSAQNEWKTIRAFKKLGVTAKPRIDTFTFNIWLSKGFRPKEGSKSVRVNNLRLFHISQCRQLTADELQAIKAEKDKMVAANKRKIVAITEAHPQ
jgi:hypothetical protein